MVSTARLSESAIAAPPEAGKLCTPGGSVVCGMLNVPAISTHPVLVCVMASSRYLIATLARLHAPVPVRHYRYCLHSPGRVKAQVIIQKSASRLLHSIGS